MEIYALILAILGLWSFIRRQRHRLAETKFEIRLFELRDKLRDLAIDGNTDTDSPLFDYMDSTISMLIREKYYITFSRIFALNIKHTQEQEIMELSNIIQERLNDNPTFKDIHKEMSKILMDYVMDQHEVSLWIFRRLYKAIRFNRQVSSLLTFPETSAANKIRTSVSNNPMVLQHA